ncbi:MAG: bifunctional riboflavin kinase/FAD synthetase [Acidobacteria bacterium]|nr:bifunctional riboflavin kinase/FAD synthetase [Acidobacteriota bacterium]
MRIVHEGTQASSEPSAVAIGVFDGLHRGHQKVLERLTRVASRHRVRSTVVTFDPHPAVILAPERAPLQIATLAQRLDGLERLGIEQVRILDFDEQLARESAASFVERVLVAELKVRHVVVGEDFRFGHNRDGDVDFLTREGGVRGFDVQPAPIFGDAHRWSSTSVRQFLQATDLEKANQTLGRPFTLRGAVVHGDARGRELGYPTANLKVHSRQILPGLGIYAGAVRTNDAKWWPGAVSVGTRPQFYVDGSILVEVHIPGFSGDLYDQEIDIALLERLRGELVFTGVKELVSQIERDVEQSTVIFEKFSPERYALIR